MGKRMSKTTIRVLLLVLVAVLVSVSTFELLQGLAPFGDCVCGFLGFGAYSEENKN